MSEIVIEPFQDNSENTSLPLKSEIVEKTHNQIQNQIQLNGSSTEPVKDMRIKNIQEKNITSKQKIQIDKAEPKYGPFNSNSEIIQVNKEKKKPNILTGQNLSLEPVVNISPKTKQKNVYKDKINVSVSLKFTEESEPNTSNDVNMEEIQKKILQIAKSIRLKAKDQNKKSLSISYQPTSLTKKQKYLTMNSFLTSIKTKSKGNNFKNSSQSKNNKIQNIGKHMHIIDKNSKNNSLFKLNSIQDVELIQEQQSFQAQQQNNDDKTNKVVKRILNDIVKQVVKASQQQNKKLPKIKLKLDPTQHHYGVTQFRRSILKQKKEIKMREFQKQKQREQILNKRREIYYNSRYHPVGVKLSNIRLSKLVAKGYDKNQQKTHPDQTQETALKNENNKNGFHGITTFQQAQNEYKQIPMNQNQSFNISQILNPQIGQLRSQSQLYKDLNSLTKQFENDSSPIQKMKKATQKEEQKTIFLLKNKIAEEKTQKLQQHEDKNQNQDNNLENNYEQQYETNLQKNSSSSRNYEEPQQYNEYANQQYDENLVQQ